MFGYFKKHVFSRLALLFAVATSVLVVSTYYVINWAVVDKDNIFDMQTPTIIISSLNHGKIFQTLQRFA